MKNTKNTNSIKNVPLKIKHFKSLTVLLCGLRCLSSWNKHQLCLKSSCPFSHLANFDVTEVVGVHQIHGKDFNHLGWVVVCVSQE